MPKQDIIRQGKSPNMQASQVNLVVGKESQEQSKESGTHLLPLLQFPKHYQANTEDLEQIHAGYML